MKNLGIFIIFIMVIEISTFGQNQYTNISAKGNTFGLGSYERTKDGNSSASLQFNETESQINNKSAIYLKDSWTNGNIITEKDRIISNFAFKYDIKNDRIEMRSIVDPTQFKVITIGNQFFIYTKFDKDEYQRTGYMQMVLNGYAKLLIRKEIKKTPGKGGAYGYEASQAIISQYYIKVGDSPAKYYSKDIDLFSIIGDKHDELTIFIKENRLKLKKKSDLLEVLNYYNNLKKETK